MDDQYYQDLLDKAQAKLDSMTDEEFLKLHNECYERSVQYSPETLLEVARLKRDLEQYNRYGYEGIFLTKQWDELVDIVGDEEATAWYQTIEY